MSKEQSNLVCTELFSDHGQNPSLHLFADTDLAGDPMSMKSHSGHFVAVIDEHGNMFPLHWSSKRQSCVSRSTTEAEIVSAATLVFEEGIPLNTVLQLRTHSEIPTILREDNSAAITIMKNGYSPKLRSLNRTHKISVAALTEAIEQRLIKLELTPTKEQLGDLGARQGSLFGSQRVNRRWSSSKWARVGRRVSLGSAMRIALATKDAAFLASGGCLSIASKSSAASEPDLVFLYHICTLITLVHFRPSVTVTHLWRRHTERRGAPLHVHA